MHAQSSVSIWRSASSRPRLGLDPVTREAVEEHRRVAVLAQVPDRFRTEDALRPLAARHVRTEQPVLVEFAEHRFAPADLAFDARLVARRPELERVAQAVVADPVPFRLRTLEDPTLRVAAGLRRRMQLVSLPADEERRAHVALAERIEHRGRAEGIRAVVERERQALHGRSPLTGGPLTSRSPDGAGGWKLSSRPDTSW